MGMRTNKSRKIVEAINRLHHPFAMPNSTALRVVIEKARRGLRNATIVAYHAQYGEVESFEIRPYDSASERASTLSRYQFKVGDKFIVDNDGNVHVAFGCGVHSMYVTINPADNTAWVQTDILPSTQCWDIRGEDQSPLVRAINVAREFRVVDVDHDHDAVVIDLDS